MFLSSSRLAPRLNAICQCQGIPHGHARGTLITAALRKLTLVVAHSLPKHRPHAFSTSTPPPELRPAPCGALPTHSAVCTPHRHGQTSPDESKKPVTAQQQRCLDSLMHMRCTCRVDATACYGWHVISLFESRGEVMHVRTPLLQQ